MKELANYKVVQYADATIRVYDDIRANAPEPISKAIIEWFEKKRFEVVGVPDACNTNTPKSMSPQ